MLPKINFYPETFVKASKVKLLAKDKMFKVKAFILQFGFYERIINGV